MMIGEVAGQGVDAGMPPEGSAHPESLTRLRLDFARNAFTNAQELIRFMDQKAFFILNAVGVLTGALGIFATIIVAVTPRSSWRTPLGITSGAVALAYLAMALTVIYAASSVFLALSHRLSTRSTGPGLIFPLNIAHRHRKDTERYLMGLATVDAFGIMRDYADSIVQVSDIYQAKQQRVNRSVRRFRLLGLMWLSTIVLLIVHLVAA